MGQAKVLRDTGDMVYAYRFKQSTVSHATANKDLSLRAMFNFAIKQKYLKNNPTNGVERFPVEKNAHTNPHTKSTTYFRLNLNRFHQS